MGAVTTVAGQITQEKGGVGRTDGTELDRLVESFLNYQRGYRRCSEATICAYSRDLRLFREHLAAHGLPQDPERIDTRVVQGFAVSLSHLAPASVNRTLNCVSSLFGFLERQAIVPRNPVRSVERPKLPARLPRGPSVSHVRALADAAGTARDRAMVFLLACCGLRRSELLALNLGDISADAAELTVRSGKGQKDRAVPIPAQCREVLAEYLSTLDGRAGPLFATGKGTRLSPTGFYRIFRRLVRKAGLEGAGITPHSLRHFFATGLLRGRADIETVRTLMGHQDLRTTSRYLFADDAGRREAVERLPLLGETDPAGDAQPEVG